MALIFEGMFDIGLLILRIFIGWIFLYHGLPKLQKGKAISSSMGLPLGFVSFLGFAEVLGGIAMILGFLTEVAALGFVIDMLGAIWFKSVKWKVPFMSMQTTGWEFDFMILGAALALAFVGAGLISIDALLSWWP